MKDYYSVLGIDSNCTAGEIKDAYRKLSKKFHPDLNDGDKYFENRFREINEAYETLNDPAKRFQYDSGLSKSRSKASSRQQEYDTSSANIKQKRPLSALAITAILVMVVLGFYLVGSFSNTRRRVLQKDDEIIVVPIKSQRHHKQKHVLKPRIDSTKPQIDSTPLIVVKPKPLVEKKAAIVKKDFLYATYIHANATGVVNMRQSDGFSSVIITTIPDDAKVLVLEKGNAYYKVSFNNNIGYVPRWSLVVK